MSLPRIRDNRPHRWVEWLCCVKDIDVSYMLIFPAQIGFTFLSQSGVNQWSVLLVDNRAHTFIYHSIGTRGDRVLSKCSANGAQTTTRYYIELYSPLVDVHRKEIALRSHDALCRILYLLWFSSSEKYLFAKTNVTFYVILKTYLTIRLLLRSRVEFWYERSIIKWKIYTPRPRMSSFCETKEVNLHHTQSCSAPHNLLFERLNWNGGNVTPLFNLC